MQLIEIRNYLQLVGRATLQDLARHFKMQESAMEHLLLFWVKKGLITHYDSEQNCVKNSCGDCHACGDRTLQIYVWS